MKLVRLSVSILILAFSTLSVAKAYRAKISKLDCQAADFRSGMTTLRFAGTYGDQSYLNVTNVNSFGFPFSQQLRIDEVRATIDDSVRIRMTGMVTGGRLFLELYNGTERGLLSSSPGDDEGGIKLKCSVKIDEL